MTSIITTSTLRQPTVVRCLSEIFYYDADHSLLLLPGLSEPEDCLSTELFKRFPDLDPAQTSVSYKGTDSIAIDWGSPGRLTLQRVRPSRGPKGGPLPSVCGGAMHSSSEEGSEEVS